MPAWSSSRRFISTTKTNHADERWPAQFKAFSSDFGGSVEALPEASSIHQRWLFALMSALEIFMGKRSRMIASARPSK